MGYRKGVCLKIKEERKEEEGKKIRAGHAVHLVKGLPSMQEGLTALYTLTMEVPA